MLAVPIHLSIDRGVFGNTLKPVELSFEPHQHSDETVLRALGRPVGPARGSGPRSRHRRPDRSPVSKDVLVDVLEHPSGYLALRRNRMFVVETSPVHRLPHKGKHIWLFGGVHAHRNMPALLDRFLEFANERHYRVAAVQVVNPRWTCSPAAGSRSTSSVPVCRVLSSFSLGGSPKMQLRNKIQKARRLGLKVVELGKDVPWDESWYAKIAEISRLWLENKGKKELDFMVGEVGGPDDHDRRIFIVLDGSENPIAFISYVPVWGNERRGYCTT